VGRRITKDLETGEVIADEDVTEMSEDELRRPLDKPRKLRIEFYSSSSSSWADLLDEEVGERFLLDPVDEQRNLIETLIILGADQGVAAQKVSEIYSPPRITQMAKMRPSLNIEGLRAFDLSTAHPGGGSWDFNKKEHRDLARRMCAEDDPDWIIGSPPCTDFSVLGRWNHTRMKVEDVRTKGSRKHGAISSFASCYTATSLPAGSISSMNTPSVLPVGRRGALRGLRGNLT
jgi:hypothetical protein